MKLKSITSHLLFRIVLAMALGIVCAWFFPGWLGRIFATFNAIFSQLLGFVIPLIILGFVAPAIAEVGTSAGRMLLVTALIAYGSTLVAGFSSYWISEWLFPLMITGDQASETVGEAASLAPYFTVEMPPLMPVMTALVSAFILGLGVAALPSGNRLMPILGEFRSIVSMVIEKVIIPLLPIYIFGIFLNMTYSGEVASILSTFAKIIGVIFLMHILWLVIQFCAVAPMSPGSRNPFRLLGTMLPAYFTALGTQSSAATIPVTLRQAEKLGVDPAVAGFTVPLCATIHMSGSTLKIVSCAVALMITRGMPFDFGMFAGFICMLGVTIIAAPGIPGGCIMASLGLLTSMLGFSDADCALMIALYIAMDSFGTACNVTGDGAIAIAVARIFRKNKRE